MDTTTKEYYEKNYDVWCDKILNIDCICGDHTLNISYNEWKERKKDGEDKIVCPKCGYDNLQNEIELKTLRENIKKGGHHDRKDILRQRRKSLHNLDNDAPPPRLGRQKD